MTTAQRFTTADLSALPQPLDDTRYEIVDGELYVSTQPRWEHQHACGKVYAALDRWSEASDLGVAQSAPGVIFAEDDNVAPDVVWISHARLQTVLGADGKLHEAPELVVEVLAPGATNQQRDREVKLKLYARRGVDEYWIVDPVRRLVEQYRREGAVLRLEATLREAESLASSLLPRFSLTVGSLFFAPRTTSASSSTSPSS